MEQNQQSSEINPYILSTDFWEGSQKHSIEKE